MLQLPLIMPACLHVGVVLIILSMLSPRGEDAWAYVGHLTYIAFHILGIRLRIWVPGWGRLLFLYGGMGASHIIPCAHLYAGHLGIEVGQLKPQKTAVFNRGKQLFFIFIQNSTSQYLISKWGYLI